MRLFTYHCRAQTYLLLYVGVETALIVMGSSKKKKKKNTQAEVGISSAS